MKFLAFVLLIIGTTVSAQITHRVGIGTYFTYAKAEFLSYDPSYTTKPDYALNPYLNYELQYKRLVSSIGLGLWNDKWNYEQDFTDAQGTHFILKGKHLSKSVFVPIAFGFDVIKTNNISFGLNGLVVFKKGIKYVWVLADGVVINNQTGRVVLDTRGSEFGTAVGGGIYISFPKVITPKLSLGYLYDIDLSGGAIYPTRHSTPYASLSISYAFANKRSNNQGIEK